MHAVAVDGPDDDKLWRLLIVIADFAQADGSHAMVPRRVLEERVGVGKRKVMSIVRQAVQSGWLAVDDPGDKRRPATYRLASYGEDRATEVSADAQTAPRFGVSRRSQRATDVKTFNGKRASTSRSRSHAVDDEPVDAYAHFPNWTAERFERENGDHP
jgi:hypothetical protein